MSPDNTSLGEFSLEGLPPAPRGVPKIEVTFDIDSNGILNASARDTATGKSQSIRITGSTRLSEGEKERMIKEAERYAEDDKNRREEADKLNAADSVCYQAEKTLADFSDRLSEDLRKRIERDLRETREAYQKRDASLASERSEKLQTVLQEAGKALYSQTTRTPEGGLQPQPDVSTPGGEARPSGSGPRGRVVDAEYTDSKK
jgi:molecular chaperone DnaK